MNFNELRYILDEALLMLRRRKMSNILAVIIMGLSLLILLVFILVTLNVSSFISGMGEEIRGYVYVEDGIDESRKEEIKYKLLGIKGVKEVVFVSREEAMEEFRESLGEGAHLLDDIDRNPLPDAYRLRMKTDYLSSKSMDRIAEIVMEWEGVEDIEYGRRWLEKGERLVHGFYMTDMALGIIVFLSVIFVISNTVRLTVLQREKTIGIMKLVGATNAYIRIPFIIEGALQGVVASLLAIALLFIIYAFGRKYLEGLVFMDPEGLVGFVAFCAFLGGMGSFTAIRKHLKI
jgi:cell division transport system permease protein